MTDTSFFVLWVYSKFIYIYRRFDEFASFNKISELHSFLMVYNCRKIYRKVPSKAFFSKMCVPNLFAQDLRKGTNCSVNI